MDFVRTLINYRQMTAENYIRHALLIMSNSIFICLSMVMYGCLS